MKTRDEILNEKMTTIMNRIDKILTNIPLEFENAEMFELEEMPLFRLTPDQWGATMTELKGQIKNMEFELFMFNNRHEEEKDYE